MKIENKKRRLGVGIRTGKSMEPHRPATIENMAEVFGSVEAARQMKALFDANAEMVSGVGERMQEKLKAGLRDPDPDDSLPDDEDTLRPGWDN
ncbi:hypothetical protein DXI23_18835 [Marinobacter flavimaris]|uniref:Uncharacterized protein n=1 Tax=Marinobacter flavimaris TaxID=262076 RepID=A0A3D8GXY1_9GAMM|nr:hypothetical protein [Marinobacter flavimaris]PPI78725.1 hypothetical protein MDHKLMBL_18760 [Marinobacter flavimaris]RDU39318.1 hypothetical protein DXI23_18835 [Marinobacter flavimaris]